MVYEDIIYHSISGGPKNTKQRIAKQKHFQFFQMETAIAAAGLISTRISLGVIQRSLIFRRQQQQQRFLKFHQNKSFLPAICSATDNNHQTTSTSISTPSSESSSIDPLLTIKEKASDLSPDLKGTSIFLIGMKSSIKSKLGKLLSEGLRYCYFDSDSLIEDVAGGASAAVSYREHDEKGYRQSETEVLKQLSSMGRLVVCAGDGAVQSSTNLALLRDGLSIWIDIPVDILARETIGVESEPSASKTSSSYSYSEALAKLASLYQANREGYATADATVSLQNLAIRLGYDDLDAVTSEDMTLEVLNEIEKLTRYKKMIEEAGRLF